LTEPDLLNESGPLAADRLHAVVIGFKVVRHAPAPTFITPHRI
jgi:hypothetical protein